MSRTNEKLPLVSFCLMSCRQKELIREAFAAALAQDYENLEIIVSDDNSQDGTWEIVQKMACEYKGPHKVIISRNEINLGIIGNWQKLCSLASGEIFVKADGDDISYPNRARVIAEDWVNSGKRAVVMASSYDKMDVDGHLIGELLLPGGWDKRTTEQIANGNGYFYIGATFACHRSIYDDFQPVTHPKASDGASFEARGLLSRRGLDIDGTIFHPFRTIREKLVRYRVGTGVTTGGAYRKFMTKGIHRCLENRLQALDDLTTTAKAYLPNSYYKELLDIYNNSVENLKNEVQLWEGDNFKVRWEAYRKLKRSGGNFKVAMIKRLLLLPKWLSDAIFAVFR